jgi:hypothetical protein
MRQAIRVMNDIDTRWTLQAKQPLVERRIGIARHALNHAVNQMHENAAPTMAHATRAFVDLRRSGVH